MVSGGLAGICEWDVLEDIMTGSDHIPVFYNIHVDRVLEAEERQAGWVFSKAKWGLLKYFCESEHKELDFGMDIKRVDKKKEAKV